MLLKNLIKNSPKSLKKIEINGLALNSKDVKKGFIFFAVKGNKSNGENYINEAIKNGAIIVICSDKCKFKSEKVFLIKTKKILIGIIIKKICMLWMEKIILRKKLSLQKY